MKWTTYDGTPGTLPQQGERVLMSFYGNGISEMRVYEFYNDDGRMSVTTDEGLAYDLDPGDRWLPLSAITPEMMDAVEAAVEACRATTETLASMIVNGADGDWFDAVLIEQERKRGAEALSRIDALEKK